MREGYVKELNNKFMEEIVKPNMTLNKVYNVMVNWKPYRALFGFTFEHEPKAIRSQRVAVAPSETDVWYTKKYFK